MHREWVTIVSGLPRSGTSLMMQMLGAGGMALLTDERRSPDVSNPRGYFELEAVKNSRSNVSWLSQASGKAVKVVHLLLPCLPCDREYCIIFMQRDLGEVIASQRAMLLNQGRSGAALPDAKLADVFERQLADVRHWLQRQSSFRVLEIQHSDVIQNPAAVARRLSEFLGGDLDITRMAAAVDPSLYRQRKEHALGHGK